MKVAGLFAGVGGIELGFRQAGHEATVLCEVWEPARAVLQARFPDVELVEDVRTLQSLPGNVDVVCAGFPCQDLSQAGSTVGIEGARSGLVENVFRLLDSRKVPWVVLENVSFMLQLARGRALDVLVTALEDRGYLWAYRVVNSLAFLPQRRERVFLVATTTDVDPADVLLVDEACPPNVSTALDTHAHGFYWTEGIRGLGWAADAVPTLKNGSTIGIPSPPAILMPDGRVIKPDIRDAERLQGFEAGWTSPATAVGRSSSRWSLVGNAVTVPVSSWLGNRLASPGRYSRVRDRPLPEGSRWPRAARYDGVIRRRVEIGAFPRWEERRPLHQFLDHGGDLLSARATRGFMQRMERGRLRFVDGFRGRLGAHLERMESGTEHAAWSLPPPDVCLAAE
jgi:DNA (cytosine-5)-methyltransferase 1